MKDIKLNQFTEKKLKQIFNKKQLRVLNSFSRQDKMSVIRKGKKYISFSCNDYLGLSQDKHIIAESVKALKKYGVGAGGSRLITGNHPLYEELENLLAFMKKTESACVFGSGFLANIGVIPAIMSKKDLIVMDQLSHASSFIGAKISQAKIINYLHNDMSDLERILYNNRKKFSNVLVLSEGVFSMDGDLAPLDKISYLAKKYKSWTMIDDAHGFGVLGNGFGSAANYKNELNIDIHMGTLSKAIGAYGGFICGEKKLVELIINRARSQIYTTGLPPSVIASAIASLKRIINDEKLTVKPLNNAKYFCELLNLPVPQSAIVPIILKDEEKVSKIANELESNGLLVGAIRPPTVPFGTSRLRVTFSSTHNFYQIEKLARVIKNSINVL